MDEKFNFEDYVARIDYSPLIQDLEKKKNGLSAKIFKKHI